MANRTFKCDLCGKDKPVSERRVEKMATLSPYPEDAALCGTCGSENRADWREILQQKRESAEECGDVDYLANN